MKKPGFWMGVLIGGLLTAPLIALFFLGDAWAGLPLVPFDIFDAAAKFPGGRLYGSLLGFAIELMVKALTLLHLDVSETAKSAEHAMAVSGQLFAGGLTGGLFFAVLRRSQRDAGLWPGLLPGGLLGLPTALASALVNRTAASPLLVGTGWIAATYLAWGAGLAWAFGNLTARATSGLQPEASVEVISRREFLVRLGTASAAITLVGAGISALLNKPGEGTATEASANTNPGPAEPLAPATAAQADAAAPAEEGPDVQRSDPRAQEIATRAEERIQNKPNAADPLEPAPGTRPEYTPLEDHYRIDINSRPPEVDGNAWALRIDGLVDTPLTLSLRDLRNNYEPRHQFVTLACISNPVGGDLTSTTLWTGVSLRQILADAGVQPEASHIEITSVDGFHESVSLDLIDSDERIMLTYYWDGKPLKPQHGYPLRIYIPDRYGMKQPKWIKRIEVLGRERTGFWVLRGWDHDAFMKATSVIDTVATDSTSGDAPLVPIGGMAHAGARGISRVQIRVDEGEWRDAALRSPLSEVAWVIWRYDWPFEAGEHVFEVRCFDGNGQEQIADDRPPPPSGASGIHSVTLEA